MSIRKILAVATALLLLAERIWKHGMVIRFFRKHVPSQLEEPNLVSILQPILSGDPTLARCLEQNLQATSRYKREFLWLVDSDDPAGQRICLELMQHYPQQNVQLILVHPPLVHVNPKMHKLITGAKVAHGDVLCVLDDDTVLPSYGLEECLPYLDQPNIGLAFGLPYYLHFGTRWSRLVSYFVNSNSLLTYIPYTALSEPFTINGMFYAIKRSVLERVGGFTGIEHTLADDFAVARRFREAGYRLAQTPLRHGISTEVRNSQSYLNLIQRWFIFPRESLMRYLGVREQLILYTVALVPALVPLLLLLAWLLKPTRIRFGYLCLYFGYNFALFQHLNRRYLRNASPLSGSWRVPLLQVLFPIQLLVALCSPQRINWRGHIMRIERGGGFRFERRRNKEQ